MEIYAVFVETLSHIEGDQRSIDFPGHGYPAHNITRTEVIEFNTKEKFIEWVHKQEAKTYGKVSYRAFKCSPVKIKTTLNIDVD